MTKSNGNAVTTRQDTLPADFGDDEVQGLSGLGYSERADDSLIPILSILQDNSAEVKKKHERYIEGVEAGHFIIRSLKITINPEEEVVQFRPAGFQRMWVRWEGEPGEGVVVAQYAFDERPEEAEEVKNQDDRKEWVMPDGSRLVDTRYHFGIMELPQREITMPMVIPMGGTNHTVSRQWTTTMKNQRLPNGSPAPAWFRRYKIGSVYRSRGAQSWFMYDIFDEGWVIDRNDRDAGRALFESMNRGEVAAATEAPASAAGEQEAAEGGAAAGDEIPI